MTVDRSGWPPGPWDSEPDRVDFMHAGLPCIMRRADSLGQWCGYVGVPPGHPYHGSDSNDVNVDVHGGVTYAGPCEGDVCHVPAPGEPDDVWWLGFDCGHAWDAVPAMAMIMGRASPELAADVMMSGTTYRTQAYVEAETRAFADRLREAKS